MSIIDFLVLYVVYLALRLTDVNAGLNWSSEGKADGLLGPVGSKERAFSCT